VYMLCCCSENNISLVQNPAEDLGAINKVFCMEVSEEDFVINVGDYLVVNLNETKKETEYVACKEPCNTNVARKSNGSQEDVAFFPSGSTGNRSFSSAPDPSITNRFWARYVCGEERPRKTRLVVPVGPKGNGNLKMWDGCF